MFGKLKKLVQAPDWYWEMLEFFRYVSHIPGKADAVFLHSRAPDDDDGLFPLMEHLYFGGTISKVVVNGGDGYVPLKSNPWPGARIRAWPGVVDYERRLTALGIYPADIFRSLPAYNTFDENRAFLNVARREGWERVIIAAQLHQLPRAVLGTLQVLRRQTNQEVGISVCAPFDSNWDKEVHGSPGVAKKPRYAHIEDEVGRILDYTIKGHLMPCEEGLKALHKQHGDRISDYFLF
jgi:hypothetical protein